MPKGASARQHAARAAKRDRQVRTLVAHAYTSVPYYRRLFDTNGVRPERIRGVADLSQIPTTTREDLAALPLSDLLAAGVDPERLVALRTSGTSGVPFTILRSWLEDRRLDLVRARALRRAGVRLGDRVARVCTVGPVDWCDGTPATRLLSATGVVPEERIDASLSARAVARRLRVISPDVIIGAPSALAPAAELFGSGRPPRVVLTAGAVLTSEVRGLLERGFGAPVRDVYGSAEFMIIGSECLATGAMHVCDDGLVLEVLRGDDRAARPDEPGEAAGTSLHAFAMPLIRYRQGDLVIRGDERAACGCGTATSTLRAVNGRVLDPFPLPDGRVLHPHALTAAFEAAMNGWVSRFQLVQQAVDHVVLRIVPGAGAPAERMRALDAVARELLSPAVQFDVVIVPAIPPERSGLRRACRSYVSPSYHPALAHPPGAC